VVFVRVCQDEPDKAPFLGENEPQIRQYDISAGLGLVRERDAEIEEMRATFEANPVTATQ
jgi:hypothetical protein